MIPLIIGFSKPKKFKLFSWIIRKIQKTPFSHVYIRFYSSKYERWLVYQASATSVNFIEFKRFSDINEIIKEFEIPASETAKNNVVQKAIDLVGAPYGVKQVIGIGIVELLKDFNIHIENPLAENNAWVCSEVVAEVLKELNMDLQIDLNKVTPKDIFLFLESLPNGQIKNG